MPHYHVVAGAKGLSAGRSMVRSSIRPGVMQAWEWDQPIGGFALPMDSMTQLPGLVNQTYDEFRAELSATPEPWWIARIYGNYARNLDAYVRFCDDPDAEHLYELFLPPMVVDDNARDADDNYPQPNLWNLAVSKKWRYRQTDEEWTALYGASSMAADADTPMAPDAGADTETDSPAM